ncbi:MAG: hypothetical protein ACQEP5_01055 [Actinomycetota bacterium]
MAEGEKKKDVGESFGQMMEEFGEAIAKVFNDPKLKQKAKEFGRSASESGKAFGDRFKDEEVRQKFREVGNAAKRFGESISEAFKEEKKGGQPEAEKKSSEIPETAVKEEESRGGRLTGYSMAIAWNIIFLIFFNFFYEYVAYYEYEAINGAGVWNRYPLLTDDFRLWLPIFTVAVAFSAAGNILMIIVDHYSVRQVVNIIVNVFGIAAAATLLSIFPFDFNAIPGADLVHILNPVVTVILVLIIIGLSIGTLVRLIKFIIYTTGIKA